MQTRPLTFVDLFTGCGGLALGLMNANWRGRFVVEKNPMAYETIAANFLSPEAASHGVNLDWPATVPQRPLAVEELLSGPLSQSLNMLRGNVDLVSGGPPCQGFSFSGRRDENDVRNRLIVAYAEFVLRVRPTLLLIENVPGILTPHGKKKRDIANPSGVGRPVKSYAERLFDLLGETYILRNGVVDAAQFGVPQTRKRFFAVGISRAAVGANIDAAENRVCIRKDGAAIPCPALDAFEVLFSIRRDFLIKRGLDPDRAVPASEAIGDLSRSNRSKTEPQRPCKDPQSPSGFSELDYYPPSHHELSSYSRLMRKGLNGHIPDSLRLARHHTEIVRRFAEILSKCPRGVRLNESDRSLYSTTLKHRIVPLAPDKPAHTITTLPDDLLHYARPRTLTVRECARLQSFPDWFAFRGKYTTGGHRRRVECPRFTQVGNAVPPLMAEAWGAALKIVLAEINKGFSGT